MSNDISLTDSIIVPPTAPIVLDHNVVLGADILSIPLNLKL